MKTKVQKWGNSLALRIPKAFAEEARVEDGADVEISLQDQALVVVRVARAPTLKESGLALAQGGVLMQGPEGYPG